MSLKKTLEEIKTVQPLAEEILDETKFIETLNARRGRKNQAIERLKQLKREYRDKIRQTAAFIVVVGDKREDFASLSQESKCFVADSEAFYKDLGSRISKVSDVKRESNSALLDILGRHLEEKMGELDVVGYNQLIFNEKYRRAIASNEEFLSWVKTVINDRVGAEIVGIQSVNSLVDPAIKAEHSGKVTPIVLPTTDEGLALDIVNSLSKTTGRVFLVGAGKVSKTIKTHGTSVYVKDPTTESVGNALKTISDSLKQ